MTRVLFVDDEPLVLAGLRRALYSRRHRWAMSFAEGGRAGLAALQAEPFDVLVTDMRMPEIDGRVLIAAARAQCPGIVCIILSGYMDDDVQMRSDGVADCYLSKPCSAEQLDASLRAVLRQA